MIVTEIVKTIKSLYPCTRFLKNINHSNTLVHACHHLCDYDACEEVLQHMMHLATSQDRGRNKTATLDVDLEMRDNVEKSGNEATSEEDSVETREETMEEVVDETVVSVLGSLGTRKETMSVEEVEASKKQVMSEVEKVGSERDSVRGSLGMLEEMIGEAVARRKRMLDEVDEAASERGDSARGSLETREEMREEAVASRKRMIDEVDGATSTSKRNYIPDPLEARGETIEESRKRLMGEPSACGEGPPDLPLALTPGPMIPSPPLLGPPIPQPALMPGPSILPPALPVGVDVPPTMEPMNHTTSAAMPMSGRALSQRNIVARPAVPIMDVLDIRQSFPPDLVALNSRHSDESEDTPLPTEIVQQHALPHEQSKKSSEETSRHWPSMTRKWTSFAPNWD